LVKRLFRRFHLNNRLSPLARYFYFAPELQHSIDIEVGIFQEKRAADLAQKLTILIWTAKSMGAPTHFAIKLSKRMGHGSCGWGPDR
jgi:hypothetical protein